MSRRSRCAFSSGFPPAEFLTSTVRIVSPRVSVQFCPISYKLMPSYIYNVCVRVCVRGLNLFESVESVLRFAAVFFGFAAHVDHGHNRQPSS